MYKTEPDRPAGLLSHAGILVKLPVDIVPRI